jgi:predicted DNA-binding protein with PD1-like motif
MANENRVQFAMRFDKYADLLDEVKQYCSKNRLALVDFVGLSLRRGLELRIGTLNEERHQQLETSQLEAKLEGIILELVETKQKLDRMDVRLGKLKGAGKS